jgi:hypothetical protein
MRRLLAVVRTDPAEEAHLAPQPGVTAVPALVDQLRATGMHIALHIDGPPVPSRPASTCRRTGSCRRR